MTQLFFGDQPDLQKKGMCSGALIEHSTASLTFDDQPTHDTSRGRPCDLSRISHSPGGLTHQCLSINVERGNTSWSAKDGTGLKLLSYTEAKQEAATADRSSVKSQFITPEGVSKINTIETEPF